MVQELEKKPAEKSRRLTSLDVLRGMAIAGMMLVNNHGPGVEVHAQIQQASWNGCTFADWIFPTFLFAVGGRCRFP